ncbi:SDR family NAD(P)-dependent oxidoreductase [Mycetocola tolaasinivorans]|uniref:SDR family NAD(P)-dependent oxidoreductase n=1 Tax=Mycetocola tolaasinivorans TaxID=76635 RepID=A0A3L7AC33_9MICO|nr:oxidoreductase [Mycetocola tolaasinivorans]RLP77370.1 SDR family NAD(P)-dependent oxidoreductase [Mycetocola tolaasinivorans]
MTRWTAEDLPSLTGKTIVVTGASSGLGEVTARELARVGARVILAVRNVEKGAVVAENIDGDTEVRELDVSSLASVRAFVAALEGPVDTLINNAGIMQVPEQVSADGFELQLATNFLGPFLLTNLLLPRITDRVVTLSSVMHRMSRMDGTDLGWTRRTYRDMGAYSDSKLADVYLGKELQRRLDAEGSPVRSMLAHPGIALTNLAVGTSSSVIYRFPRFLNDAAHGALPTLYAATQDIPGGSFVGPDGAFGVRGYPKIIEVNRRGRDPELARRIWAEAERMTGLA